MSNQQLQKRENDVTNALQMESIKNQLTGLLSNNPRQMEAFKTKMIKMSMNEMLKGCTPESIINCGIQALTLDLPLEAGQGYIVKYGKVAQLDVGYKGWSVLAKRSGFSVMADPVYSCDDFSIDGFGFDVQYNFQPNESDRKITDDKWVRANIAGVIVSVREDATKLVTPAFVSADMLNKIISMSPSQSTKFSPYNNWAHQMMCAKAIKHVVSKMPVDISKASMLNDAIQIVNTTESNFQQQPAKMPEYSQERFDEVWPQWVELVSTGQKKASAIITQLTNGFSLTASQIELVMTLQNHEPIDGETVDADTASDTAADGRLAREAEAEKDTYNDADFKKLYKLWQISIEKGESTVDGLIENIQKTHTITDAQMSSLQGLHDAAPIAQEA